MKTHSQNCPDCHVAQIFNLLYRGFVIRRAFAEAGALENSHVLPIANRRYGRVQLCATSHAQRAFSLLELMVSVAILAVIIVGLLAMFNQVHRAFRGGTAQVDVMEGGRAAMSLMTREISEVTATPVTNSFDFYGLFTTNSAATSYQDMAVGNPRENQLMDLSFMTRANDEWMGIGYRVRNTNVPGVAVGTLYRIVVTTNSGNFSSDLEGPTNILRMSASLIESSPDNYNPGGQYSRTNYHRVIDGVVHFLVTAFSTDGIESTNHLVLSPPGTFGYGFTNQALPGYIEIELGVLEPAALAKFNARLELTPGDPTKALDYLKKNVGKVHLFRQRVAIHPGATTLGPGT